MTPQQKDEIKRLSQELQSGAEIDLMFNESDSLLYRAAKTITTLTSELERVEQMECVSLVDRSAVERAMVGALKSCIDAHGPITFHFVSSAAKRVVSALKQQRKEKFSELTAQLTILQSAVKVILPMAKGYAAEHPVGNNQKMVNEVDERIYGSDH